MSQKKVPDILHLPMFRGNPGETFAQTFRELQLQWTKLATIVNRGINYYEQASEPTIPTNSIAFLQDTDGGPAYYLVVNVGGTQKKVEVT